MKLKLSKYDRVVIATGLAFDKLALNKDIIPYICKHKKNWIFLSHLSDAVAASYLASKLNKGKQKAFIIYGDKPFVENQFIGTVYITFSDKAIGHYAIRLMNSSTKDKAKRWGYWRLSYLLKKLCDKYNEINIKIYDKNPNQLFLEKLIFDYAGCICCQNKNNDLSTGGMTISTTKLENSSSTKRNIEFHIGYPISIIQDKSLLDLFGDNRKIAFVTIGGAEHNVFLRFLIQKNRDFGKERFLFDKHNEFDYSYWKEHIEKSQSVGALLSTHELVGLSLKDEEGNTYRFERKAKRKNDLAAGILIIRRGIKILNKEVDFWGVFGSGLGGAIATKLSILSLLNNSFNVEKINIFFNTFETDENNNLVKKFASGDVITKFEVKKDKEIYGLVTSNWKKALWMKYM